MDRIKILTIIAGVALLLSMTNLAATYALNNKLTNIENSVNDTSVPRVTSTPAPEKFAVSIDDDSVKGSDDAPITMIEFSDYECPFCERFYLQTLPHIQKDYIDTGKVKYVFRDYPLSFHLNATKAAEAAECAGEQKKYWDYHDTLFQHQNALDNKSLKQYALNLGLDTAAFNQCLDSGAMAGEVQNDFEEGSRLGIRGTPTFFINGTKVVGAQPYDTIKQIFERELAP